MKKNLFLGIIVIALMAVSFFIGSYTKEQEYNNGRLQRCKTMISFALEKAENEDISEPDMMEAIISNVYGAYVLCDDSIAANQLHDLWNVLIFEGNNAVGTKDILLEELRSVSERLDMIE